MGRKKVELAPVMDKTLRRVSIFSPGWPVLQICLAKRKRGLLKKTMEMSILTNCKIMLAIHDSVDKKVTFYKNFSDD